MATSLMAKQAAAVAAMLNLNKPPSEEDDGWSSDWKILVYDAFCRDIISPLFHVADLRRRGVTLHLLLDSEREAIPDVPAVYFVQPTEEAVRRIAADCGEALYAKMYLNFVSPLPRPLLESLARATLANNGVASISKLYDQFLSFVCLEPSLFSLNMNRSYLAYNDPRLTEGQVEGCMRSIAAGLFAVFACLGTPPIIKCQADGPGHMVARMLDSMIRDHITSHGGVFTAGIPASGQRAVCIIVDRSIDLAVPLRHSSTYQSLVDDLLGSHLRKVVVPGVAVDGSRPKTLTYDLDAATDTFWAAHRRSPFPVAIEGHDRELKAVLEKEAAIRRTAGHDMDETDPEAAFAEATGAKGLVEAVDSLPALLKQKKTLDMHTNIMKAVMDEISSRHIPTYFEAESFLSKDAVFGLLADPSRGNITDKARLAVAYVLNAPAGLVDAEEIKRLLSTTAAVIVAPTAEAASGALPQPADPEKLAEALAAVDYAVTTRRTTAAMSGESTSGPTSAGGSFMGMLGKTTTSLLSKAAQGVKTLVSGEVALPLTRVVQAVCDGKASAELDSVITFDPKLSGGGSGFSGAASSGEASFAQAVVFVIGGGSFNEYHNLLDYAKARKTGLDIVYGATELSRPSDFLAQLAALGATRSR